MSKKNVERKPSGTARGTALLRTLAKKEIKVNPKFQLFL